MEITHRARANMCGTLRFRYASNRSVALEALTNVHFVKGSEEGSGQGSRKGAICGAYQNQIT